jgi:RNA polymerase sigma factor (sigma-70 family)
MMDEYLLMKIADNDEKAFEEFHLATYLQLTKICYNRKVPEDEIEDLLQEIYARIWVIRLKFKVVTNCFDYVIGIACNLIADYNRNRAKHQKTLIIDSNLVENSGQVLLLHPCSSTDNDTDIDEMALCLIRALPCKQQQAMLLSRQGVSRKEIAAEMEISVAGVDRLLQCGRRTLYTSIHRHIQRH